jgi:hypothetical protein
MIKKFKYGGNVSEGGKKDGARDARGGSSGDGGGRKSDAPPHAGGGGGQTAGLGNRGGIAGGRRSDGNATIADKMIMDRYIASPDEKINNEKDYWSGVKNLGQAAVDYNEGDLGNLLAGALGIREVNPVRQALGARTSNPNASWGFDPLHGIAALAGLGVGAPIATAYNASRYLSGWNPPMLSFDGFHGSAGFGADSPGSQGIGGLLGGGVNDRDRIGGGTGNNTDRVKPTEQSVTKPTTSPSSQVPTQDSSSEYPIGGKVVKYPWDINTYGMGPMWDFIRYPGQDNYPLAKGGLPRYPSGQVNGPGGPKDDLVGPIALSNKEYVLPVEMISHFGGGDYDKGIDALEILRKKVIKR